MPHDHEPIPFMVDLYGKWVGKYPGIPTTIKTMGVHITTIAYLRVLIIGIGSTILLMVVEAHGIYKTYKYTMHGSYGYLATAYLFTRKKSNHLCKFTGKINMIGLLFHPYQMAYVFHVFLNGCDPKNLLN